MNGLSVKHPEKRDRQTRRGDYGPYAKQVNALWKMSVAKEELLPKEDCPKSATELGKRHFGHRG
jgi:hypothetical protein